MGGEGGREGGREGEREGGKRKRRKERKREGGKVGGNKGGKGENGWEEVDIKIPLRVQRPTSYLRVASIEEFCLSGHCHDLVQHGGQVNESMLIKSVDR